MLHTQTSRRWGPAAVLVAAAACPAQAQLLFESFSDLTQLSEAGWTIVNRSLPIGPTTWFQGNTDVMDAYSQPGYIAVNAGCAIDSGTGDAARSVWLITPMLPLSNGDSIVFRTRAANTSWYADRLQVRFSTAGPSSDVGTDPESTGDFAGLLLDINPEMNTRAYPDDWTMYTVSVSGIPNPVTGRIAFRYYLPAGSAYRGNYIGIDNFAFFDAPPPPCYANCDGSSIAPVLNVNDFSCFLNKFAAHDPSANCDGSTIPPVLNINDFACFLNKFAAGCL